jgi:hypothetical protein
MSLVDRFRRYITRTRVRTFCDNEEVFFISDVEEMLKAQESGLRKFTYNEVRKIWNAAELHTLKETDNLADYSLDDITEIPNLDEFYFRDYN